MRDACTFPMVRRSRLAPDSHLRKLKQPKAQEQLANEMALVSEPGEADDLGSGCTTTQACWDKVSCVFFMHESASKKLGSWPIGFMLLGWSQRTTQNREISI